MKQEKYLMVLMDSRGALRFSGHNHGDATAGVDEGDGGRRWRSSCGLVRREEEEDEKEKRGE